MKRPFLKRIFAVPSLLLFLAFPAPASDEVLRFALTSGTPAIEETGVPALHEVLPESLAGEGLSIEPLDDPYGWWREASDGRPFRLRVSVSEEVFERAVLTVWNPHNKAVASRIFKAGESRKLEFAVGGLGAWLLTLDGFSDGEAQKRFVRCLARTEDLREARGRWRDEEFFLGVCAFPGRYHWQAEGRPVIPPGLGEEEARDREADLLARAGFQVVRLDVSMEMGPAPGGGGGYLHDFTRMDAAVEAYVSRGFSLALQLMNAGDWAIAGAYAEAPEPRWPLPRDEAHQRAYTRALVERYGRHARFVQIHNEPDQREFWAGEPEEFVAQHRAMLEEVRRFDPALPVANGGYAFIEENRTRFFVRELRGHSDFQAYHAHGDLAGLRRNFSLMRRLHEEAGYGTPVYLNTETGFDAWRLDQERRQGQAVAQRTLYCWAHGHRGALLFCGRMTRGPGREGRDLGLLDYEFGPRFAYAAVAGLVSAMVGASPDAVLAEEGEGLFLYRFFRGSEWILAGFTLDDAGEEVLIDGEGGTVEFIDEMGNRGPAERRGAATRLALNGYPRYWVFGGGGEAPTLPEND